jgi:thioredoxin-like negative regulator of GroEL
MLFIRENVEQFNQAVQQSKPIFVIFHWASCEPCKQTIPEWHKIKGAFNQMNGEFVVAEIEQTLLPQVKDKNGQPFEVQGFPTIKYVSPDGSQEDYSGNRDVDSFVSWINSHVQVTKGPKVLKGSKVLRKSRKQKKSKKQRKTQKRKRTNKRRYHK